MDHEEKPRGTLAVMIIFIIITAILWVLVYSILLQRGGG